MHGQQNMKKIIVSMMHGHTNIKFKGCAL